MSKICHWMTLAALALPLETALAADPLDFNFVTPLSQADYETLVRPIASPMRFQFVHPAETTGVLGFDVGLAGTFIEVPQEARNLATIALEGGADLEKNLILPRLTAQKGLPFGIDVAGNLAMIPGTEIMLWGLGAQYELELPIPILPIHGGLRGTYSNLAGIDELEVTHFGMEALVSAQLLPGVPLLGLQPWLGFGYDSAKASSDIKPPTGAVVPVDATWNTTYFTAGATFTFTLVRLSAEGQFPTGDDDDPVYSLKLSAGI